MESFAVEKDFVGQHTGVINTQERDPMSSVQQRQDKQKRSEQGTAPLEAGASSPQRLQLKSMDYASQQSALRPTIQKQEAGGGEAAAPEAAPGTAGASVSNAGNGEGAAAIATVYAKMQETFVDENFTAMGLSGREQQDLRAVMATASEYTSNNLVHMETATSTAPPEISSRFGNAFAVFEHATGMIYLQRPPQSSGDMNTIIHELSHASRAATESMLLMARLRAGLESAQTDNATVGQFFDAMDAYLLEAREERDAEIDGNLGRLVLEQGAPPEQGEPQVDSSSQGLVKIMQARETGEGSSREAWANWESDYKKVRQYLVTNYEDIAKEYVERKREVFPAARNPENLRVNQVEEE